MKRLLFPVVFFSCLGALYVFGMASENLSLAVFFGRFQAIITDPLIIAAGLILGAFFVKPHHLATAAVLAGFFISVYIAHKNALIGARFSYPIALVRITAVLAYAFVTNIPRVALASQEKDPGTLS